MAKAFLSLGSNQGDSRTHIRAAIRELGTLGTVEEVSSLYETEPVGFVSQPFFLNCVVVFDTELAPEALLAAAKRIEADLGRVPGPLNGPRSVDIDILLYNDATVAAGTLVIPHPRMHVRRFVLEPLAEIAPGVMHPVIRKTAAGLLAVLDDAHGCTRLPPEKGFPFLLH